MSSGSIWQPVIRWSSPHSVNSWLSSLQYDQSWHTWCRVLMPDHQVVGHLCWWLMYMQDHWPSPKEILLQKFGCLKFFFVPDYRTTTGSFPSTCGSLLHHLSRCEVFAVFQQSTFHTLRWLPSHSVVILEHLNLSHVLRWKPVCWLLDGTLFADYFTLTCSFFKLS